MQQQIVGLLPWVGLLVIFYFILIRPQQQQQKKRKEMLSSIKAGARVVTIGGLHGTIVSITDDVAVVRVADGVELTFNRNAIGSVRSE